MEKLISKVKEWAWERELDVASPTKQTLKLQEEVGELAGGIIRNDKEVIVDSIGDILVVLTILAQQLDLELKDCLQIAYNEIKNRQGKTINGSFIKQEDLDKIENKEIKGDQRK